MEVFTLLEESGANMTIEDIEGDTVFMKALDAGLDGHERVIIAIRLIIDICFSMLLYLISASPHRATGVGRERHVLEVEEVNSRKYDRNVEGKTSNINIMITIWSRRHGDRSWCQLLE